MYLHDCTGAECVYCSPWSLPQRWDAEVAARLGQIKMQHWRNSCGEPVTTFPKALRPSTTVIILLGTMENREVLCQQRADNGWWGFPGGAQEIGESLAQCAIREALEETGLVVHLRGVTSVDSDPEHYALCSYLDGVVQYTNVTFLAYANQAAWDTTRPIVTPCQESIALEWHSIHRLPKPFLLNHRWRLEQALAHWGPSLPVR